MEGQMITLQIHRSTVLADVYGGMTRRPLVRVGVDASDTDSSYVAPKEKSNTFAGLVLATTFFGTPLLGYYLFGLPGLGVGVWIGGAITVLAFTALGRAGYVSIH